MHSKNSLVDEQLRPSSSRASDLEHDAEWFSAIIGTIYDCVLAPGNWNQTLAAIVKHFGIFNAMLGVAQLRPGAHQLMAQVGFDDEWLAAMDGYTEDMFDFWGGRTLIDNFPLEEPILSTEVMPASLYLQNRYYRDILQPRGLGEGVVIPLARENGLSGYMGISGHMSDGPINSAKRQGLRLLAPHIRRAVTISDFFNLQAIEHQTFWSVLKSMRHAVLLVDEAGMVGDTNPAADALLATTAEIEVSGRRLKLANPLAQRDLDAALRLAAEDEAKLERRGIGVPVSSEGGAPLMLHLMPLGRTELRRGLNRGAAAAVFIVSADRRINPPLDAIALLYNFTPAETQIFAMIAGGQTLDEIAATLGIGRGTAKTHLLRIFNKTGCNRQAELVALAHQLAAPL